MRSALRRMGNSTGLIVPRAVLREAGLESGAILDLVVEEGRIVASPAPGPARAGWSEAAKGVGGAPPSEDEADWRAFGTDDDLAVVW